MVRVRECLFGSAYKTEFSLASVSSVSVVLRSVAWLPFNLDPDVHTPTFDPSLRLIPLQSSLTTIPPIPNQAYLVFFVKSLLHTRGYTTS